MGSGASVWVLNVAMLGAIPRRRCAEGSSGKPRLPRLLRRRVHWKNLSCVPAEVPERAPRCVAWGTRNSARGARHDLQLEAQWADCR
jgi:hypothetical protein